MSVYHRFQRLRQYTVNSLSPVSTTPAINPCHGFSVIAGITDTGDTVWLTPLINFHSNIQYLHEFSKKLETVLMGYSGAREKLNNKKKLVAENLVPVSL